MDKNNRLKKLENQSLSTQVLEGEPVQGENLLEWLWQSAIYYMQHGYISAETGEVVKGAVSGLPPAVQERIETVSAPIGKLISLDALQNALRIAAK